MNAIIEKTNSVGYTFIEFALPMLIQASVLNVLLLLADVVLRKRVRAVFRYWILMLILVKLVLPTSLSGPFSLGYWFGDEIASVDVSQSTYKPPSAISELPAPVLPYIDVSDVRPTVYSPSRLASMAEAVTAEPPVQIQWQGVVFLFWLAIVIALLLLLAQRAMFVRGLVGQAKDASRPMYDVLDDCRKGMKVKRRPRLKVSPNATSPAICGLIQPVILVPNNLSTALGSEDLRVVLLHELAHVKRGDLWVNLAQTLLQIIYFYNPLLWLANAVIRRAREQAVDEAVLVAMGEGASRYPQTLVSVAKLAFKRPGLSLRLIGVVESKSALTARIKRILSRPVPKSARLGIVGLAAIIIIAAFILPMAQAQPYTDRAAKVMKLAEKEARQLNHAYIGTEHILLALAGQSEGVAAEVLDKLGIGTDALQGELKKLIKTGSETVTKSRLPQSPRAKKTLKHARNEARALDHDYIGTEHILLGLMREKEGVAAQMLANLGVSFDVARSEVLDFVKPGPGGKTDVEVEVESEKISGVVDVQDSSLGKSTSAEAAFVIQKVLDRYASIKTYSAIGELLTDVDHPPGAMGAIPGMTTEMLQQMGERQLKSIFTIKMARPNLYCIEWNQHIDTGLSKVGNAWSVGGGSYGLILGKEKSFEKPLRALIGTAGNMGRAQSSLFFDTSLNTLRKLRDLSQQEDEQLEGIECYVISGSLYRRTYTYWVSKKDFMIRRYKYVSGGDGEPVEGGGDELTEEAIRHYLKATDKEATPEEIAKMRTMLTAAEAMASEVKVTNTETYRNIILDRPISKGQFIPSNNIDEITEELKNLQAQYIHRLKNISPTDPNLKADVQIKPGPGRPKYSATLANGITVELAAYLKSAEKGLKWYSFDGKPTTVEGVTEADVDGLGSVVALRVVPSADIHLTVRSYQGGDRKDHRVSSVGFGDIRTVGLGDERRFVNLDISVKRYSPFESHRIDLAGRNLNEEIEINKFDVVKITNIHRQDPGSCVLRVRWVADRNWDRWVGLTALDKAGKPYELRGKRSDSVIYNYTASLPIERLAGIILQSRVGYSASAKFKNVSLVPDYPTDVQVEVMPQPEGSGSVDAEVERAASETARQDISGLVTDENGDPIVGAVASIMNKDLVLSAKPTKFGEREHFVISAGAHGVTGSDGHFTLACLKPGRTDISIQMKGYRTEFLRDVPTGTSNLKVTLREPSSYTLAGKVIDAEGNPVSGVEITLSADSFTTVQTGEDGEFHFDTVLEPIQTPNARQLFARKKGFGVWGKYLDTSGAETFVKITLLPETVVSGRVTDKAGEPIPDAKVGLWSCVGKDADFAYNAHHHQIAPKVRTGADGQFILKGMPQESIVYLYVEADRYAHGRAEGIKTGTFNGYARQIKYDEGMHTMIMGVPIVEAGEIIEVKLQRAATLRGVVVYEDTNQPAAGVKVRVHSEHNWARAATATDGRFEIIGVNPESCRIVFAHKDSGEGSLSEWTAPAVEIKSLDPGEVKDDLRMVLTKGGVIGGRAMDAKGNPLGGVLIAFYSAAGPRSKGTSWIDYIDTLADGSWSYRFPPGQVHAFVNTNDLGTWSKSEYMLDLKKGQMVDNLDFTLSEEVPENSPYRRIPGKKTDVQIEVAPMPKGYGSVDAERIKAVISDFWAG